jgi:hypothetical protein
MEVSILDSDEAAARAAHNDWAYNLGGLKALLDPDLRQPEAGTQEVSADAKAAEPSWPEKTSSS